MKNNKWKLDNEEQELLDSYNRGEWVEVGEDPDYPDKYAKYKAAAKQTFAKTHRINFRVSERDFRSVQIKARQQEIPYQTLISGVLHKYLTGQLQEIIH